MTINATTKYHIFADGWVMSMKYREGADIHILTYGEGNSWTQSKFLNWLTGPLNKATWADRANKFANSMKQKTGN